MSYTIFEVAVGVEAHLLSQTHVEIVLDAIAASSDLVPDTFCVALVQRLNEMCAVCWIIYR